MKPKETKDKALVLYLKGISEKKVAKEVEVNPLTIAKWKKDGKWAKLKKEANEKSDKKIMNKYSDYTEKQKELSYKTIKSLITKLPDLTNKELIELLKALQVVTSKNITNITQDSYINVDLPKLIQDIRNGSGT